MSSVAYIMQWGDHKTNVHNHLRLLFEEQKFVDLTLFCSTHSVKVHSVVVASNSSYFEKVLLSQNGVNSVIVLKDMKFEVLRALIEFMYCGETTVLDEDVDALLYASKKFEVKGLSRMTRQGIMFSSAGDKGDDPPDTNHRFIFPAESAQPGIIQAVMDLTKKKDEATVLDNSKLDSLYFKKTVFQKRGRPHKNHGNIDFPEAAMSDTEYAILKEAEESRKALEKLQKYVLNPSGLDNGATRETPFVKNISTSDNSDVSFKKSPKKSEEKPQDHSYSNSRHSIEDEIAAENLTNELNQQSQSDVTESTLLPTDVPIFVDDGNGNYVTLDVEMANMIAGQEIKYNLVQGVVMTSDGKGSQLSNPASILIPETQIQPESMPILNCYQTELEKIEENSRTNFWKPFGSAMEENSIDNGKGQVVRRKPFVVKEIIKLKQGKKFKPTGQVEKEEEEDGLPNSESSLIKFDNPEMRGILF